MYGKEQRTGENPVPENLGEFLNEARLLALRKMEGFGWELKFVRRPLFQEVVPVLFHPDSNKYGVLEDDGKRWPRLFEQLIPIL